MTWKLPDQTDCKPGLEPLEWRVLVAMAEKEKTTSGGIILPDATRFREEWGSDHALLVAVSPQAFSYMTPEQWNGAQPRVGDTVFVGKFPGDEIMGHDGRKYRLCSDKEVLAVIARAVQRDDAASAVPAEAGDTPPNRAVWTEWTDANGETWRSLNPEAGKQALVELNNG